MKQHDPTLTRGARRGVTGRRRFLALAGAAWCVCAGWAGRVLAGARPAKAFSEEGFDATMDLLFGGRQLEPSDAVRIGVAELAENGAVVPLKVEVDIEGVRAITLLASKNPVPLIARFELADGVESFVATRVKLAETSDVVAVAETAEQGFIARKTVEVTIGGCGG